MKTHLFTTISILFLFINAYTQEKLHINTSKSELKWFGDYTFYFGGHYGNVNFKDGYFIKTNTVITGGEFNIDMTSITSTDIENEEANESLVNHLKDPDFFDVASYPLAKLQIKKVKYHDQTHMLVYADLTIKNKTLPIEFQAEVNYETQQMLTKFKIDRMRWDITYNSIMRDGAISDAIGFEVVLSL